MEREAWAKVRATVMYLKEMGVRVDGIGWQGHVDTGFEKEPANMKQLNELITWAHSNDLEFHVTENTVWVRDGASDANLTAQAETFRAIVKTLLEHSEDGVVTWNAWQMRDTDPKTRQSDGNAVRQGRQTQAVLLCCATGTDDLQKVKHNRVIQFSNLGSFVTRRVSEGKLIVTGPSPTLRATKELACTN